MSMRPAASNKSKVVIGLDDEPESVTLLGQIVGKAGYTFFGTTSSPQCLSLLSRIEPRQSLDIAPAHQDLSAATPPTGDRGLRQP